MRLNVFIIHTAIYSPVYSYIHIHTATWLFIHIAIRTRLHTATWLLNTQDMCMYMCMYTYVHIHIHTATWLFIHIAIRTRPMCWPCTYLVYSYIYSHIQPYAHVLSIGCTAISPYGSVYMPHVFMYTYTMHTPCVHVYIHIQPHDCTYMSYV